MPERRRASVARRAFVAALLAAPCLFAGCGEAARETQRPPAPGAEDEKALRIASLSPAMTSVVVELGLGGRVVGRTPWCTGVDSEVMVVGDLNQFDAERLVRLHPTHVLVQPPRAGEDPALERLAREQGWVLVRRRVVGLDDITALIEAMPADLAGSDAVLRERLDARARVLVSAIDDRLRDDDRATMQAAGPVLLLFSIDPPMAFGAGSYLGDMLERLGATNVVTAHGYPQLTLEDLVRLSPGSVILVRAEPEAEIRGEDAALWGPLAELDLDAFGAGRTGVLRDPAALTPGPEVGRVAEALRAILRACAATPAAGEGAGLGAASP